MNDVYDILKTISAPGLQEDGSYTRLAFSEEYFESARLVEEELKLLGLTTHIDQVGNVHGRWEVNPDYNNLILGSHMDTVKNGGLYDGALGVACAIDVVSRMKRSGIDPKKNLEVIAFNAEEGSPIGGTFGSRALMGLIEIKPSEQHLYDALGISKEMISSVIRDTSKDFAYLELHIEQGDLLYKTDKKIGIVTGIAGITRYKLTVIGEANHAGTTMMNSRKDALVQMSKLIVWIDELSKSVGDGFVSTIGTISLEPNSVNVIPGKVECVLELRHLEKRIVDEFVGKLRDHIQSNSNDFEIIMEELIYKKASFSDPKLVAVIEEQCKLSSTPYTLMHSGAGHDTNAMATKMPNGMIFVPSIDGISHSVLEKTSEEDIRMGCNILYDTVIALTVEEEIL